MRYNHQFEFVNDIPFSDEHKKQRLSAYSGRAALGLGEMIVKQVGIEPVESGNPMVERHGISIEAFSSKEWNEFKAQLTKYIETTNDFYSSVRVLDLIMVGKLFKALEAGELLNSEQKDERSVAT
jgi:hypothetical protein